eukprot:scaffold282_cov345-Pavlova_lutheri.AAC.11
MSIKCSHEKNGFETTPRKCLHCAYRTRSRRFCARPKKPTLHSNSITSRPSPAPYYFLNNPPLNLFQWSLSVTLLHF